MSATEFLNEVGSNQAISLLKKLSLWLLALVGIAALVSIYFGEIREQTELTNHSDFYKFYLSSGNLLQDKPIYWPAPDRVSPTSHCNLDLPNKVDEDVLNAMPEPIRLCLHPNLNPPFFIALTTPFSLLDYPQALWAWSLASIVSGIWALILILKSDASPTTNVTTKILIGLAFFAYYPTFANSSYGQLTLFLLLDAVLAWLALRNGKNLSAGCWLGLAAGIKPFFGLFLIALFISRNWRGVSGFVAACGFSFLVGGLIAGFSAYTSYLSILSDVHWLTTSWNGSYAGFFARLFGSGDKAWVDVPMLARGLPAICSLVTMAVLGGVVFKLSKSTDRKLYADALFALTVPAMLLISPLGWSYYFPLLLVSFVVIWNITVDLPNGRICRLLLLAVTIPTIPPKLMLRIVHSPKAWFWDGGVYFYLLLFTFLLAAFLAYRTKSREAFADEAA